MSTSHCFTRTFTITAAIVATLAVAASPAAHGSVGYSIPGSVYSENFDSLPNTPENTSLGASPVGWMDDTASPGVGNFSILGWYLYHPTSQSEGGFNNHQRMRIGAGTATTGTFMSFGSSGSTDRALGDIGSNTMAPTPPPEVPLYIGLLLRNDTGIALDRFTLSYYGEQWRDGGNTSGGSTPQTMNFMWSTTAGAINDPDTAFATVTALDFTSPVYGATSGTAVDGNGAGRVYIGPITVTGISWQPGMDLWLRWADVNNVGNDHGLAIDDLAFSAIPEPSCFVLVALGIAGLLLRSRRQR